MDEDILSEIDRQLTNVNLDKYWERKVGDYSLWIAPIDYVQSNRVKQVMSNEKEEFPLEEAKRVTIASAIVGVNGVDMRRLRHAGKAIKVRGPGGKDELVDLPELIYRKIAHWDVEFVDLVFEVYSDVLESHKKEMSKDIVFENAKNPEEELDELEEKASEIRRRLGKPPLVEARVLSEEPEDLVGSREPEGPEGPEGPETGEPEPPPPEEPAGERVSFSGRVEDFDPFAAVSSAAPAPVAPPAPSPVPVPVVPAQRSPIEAAMSSRGKKVPVGLVPGVQAQVGQPSVPQEVIDRPAERVVAAPPRVDQGAGTQSLNPRFRRSAT